jgi:hypothetical protein
MILMIPTILMILTMCDVFWLFLFLRPGRAHGGRRAVCLLVHGSLREGPAPEEQGEAVGRRLRGGRA